MPKKKIFDFFLIRYKILIYKKNISKKKILFFQKKNFEKNFEKFFFEKTKFFFEIFFL